jgi:putative DNA primase/helicase
LITRLAPVDYDPKAPCELWEKFLHQIQDGNYNVIHFIKRALGYALTGSCREECLFILWGGGANGKTTLINTISHLLGDYARNTPIETLLAKTHAGEIPTDVARLDGPRFVTASEVDRGKRLAESLVKALTGRDTVSARFLYGEYFDFVPQFKLFLSTNNKPIIRGNDDAIWRRIMFLKFPVQIPKDERDQELCEKLRAEASGILAWLVHGCRWWYDDGLMAPAEVIEATDEYRSEMDVLADFLKDKCLVAPGILASSSDLYAAYKEWADDQGLTDKERLKQRSFGMCLAERGFRKDKGTAGRRLWRGVGLRDCINDVPLLPPSAGPCATN